LEGDQGDNPSPNQLLNQNREGEVPGSTSGATSPSVAYNNPWSKLDPLILMLCCQKTISQWTADFRLNRLAVT
jgi:hypothetical protein